MRKRVIGLGGVFFKSNNPNELKQWYARHLGFNTDEYGTLFPNPSGYSVWSPFSFDTDYFQPSTKEFMINFVVENLEELVLILRQEGVALLDEIEQYEYGKFVHLLDPEGNKIELWEPPKE